MILGNKEINSLETFDKLLLNSDIIYYYIFFLYFTDIIFIDLYIIVILYRNNKYCNLSREKNMDLYNLF